MPATRRLAPAVLALVGVLAWGPPAWAGVVVRVAPQTVVSGGDVRLGDIARVEGDEPAARSLRGLRLGPAPAVGVPHRFDGTALRGRIRAAHPAAARAEVVVPDQVVVRRASQVVPASALVEAVRSEARLLLAPSDGHPATLLPLAPPADLEVPAGRLALAVRLAPAPANAVTVAATVTVQVDGADYQTVPLTFRVGRYRSVAVAVRPLAAGAALGPADVRPEPRLTGEIPPDALPAAGAGGDVEALRPIAAGEILTVRNVRPRVLVRRGEVVTLVIESGPMRITTLGQASADASRGQMVRVLNTASRREVLGQAEAPGLVRVPFLR